MNSAWKPTRRAFVAASIALPFATWADAVDEPPLMLAKVFTSDLARDLSEFWLSEKLDGVRAYWSGSELLTRAGHPIAAPRWFTEALPKVPLDGELWGGRGTFESTSGIVRSTSADDASWRRLHYMLFDLPAHAGSFDARLSALREQVAVSNVAWLQAVTQVRVEDSAMLAKELQRVEEQGGEGLMLHRATSRYRPGRSDDVLKLKSALDAEARVIGYEPGKGKYVAMVGALLVERDDGVRFKIGSGLTDAERRDPPRVGSWVTYAYNGETGSGLPRFPRFVRVREE